MLHICDDIACRCVGAEELIGSDVVLVHRLLKNHVAEELGIPAYALYTSALVGAMALADPVAAGMRAHRETFESVGEVASWITPRLGGVGPTTVAMLLRNTVEAAERAAG